MEKTKLGISVGLLAAAVYFMGLINVIPMVLLAGYVLLAESNEWLRRSAVKAVVIYVGLGLIPEVFDVIDYLFGVVNVILGWLPLPFSWYLKFPANIDSLILYAVSLIRSVLLLVLGLTALSQGSVKVNAADKLVDKNM